MPIRIIPRLKVLVPALNIQSDEIAMKSMSAPKTRLNQCVALLLIALWKLMNLFKGKIISFEV